MAKVRVAYDTTIAIARMFLGGIPSTPALIQPPAPAMLAEANPPPALFGKPITHI